MNNTKPEPVVYRSDFISSCDQLKILQSHLDRLGFSTSLEKNGIDAASASGWLAVEDGEGIHYISEGWEERLAALELGCDQQDLWEALGDAEDRISEIADEIQEAVEANAGNITILPFKTEVEDIYYPGGGAHVDWNAPEQWVKSVLNC